MAPAARENAALVRRFLTDVVACGDTNAVADFLAVDVGGHRLVFEGAQPQGTVTELGRQALASADVDLHIEVVVASDDHVAVRGRVTGTHQESLMDLAPTGRSFEIACAWFCRIENDRIAEIWSLPDGLGLLTQLDASPRSVQHGHYQTHHKDSNNDSHNNASPPRIGTRNARSDDQHGLGGSRR